MNNRDSGSSPGGLEELKRQWDVHCCNVDGHPSIPDIAEYHERGWAILSNHDWRTWLGKKSKTESYEDEVEGWMKPNSLDLDLKITRDEEAIKRHPRKCLTLDDLIELSKKILELLKKHEELNP